MADDVPKRWPLAETAGNRYASVNQDARLVNCFVEKDDQGNFEVYKRPGLSLAFNFGTDVNGWGCYHCNGFNYIVQGPAGSSANLYKSTIGIVGTLTGTNASVYRFNELYNALSAGQAQGPFLYMDNATGGGISVTGAYVFNTQTNTLTNVTDVNFPKTGPAFGRVKGSIYLDGSLYVCAGNQVFESATNDATTWPALNVLTAEAFADHVVAGAKQLNYVIVLKQWSTEIFYDASNPTGSSLAEVNGACMNLGCANQNTVRQVEDILIWMTSSKVSPPRIVMLQNLLPTYISTPAIERLIRSWDVSDQTGFVTRALICKMDGHTFYILTNTTANLTLVYDLDQGLWSQWTDTNGNYWPMIGSCYDVANNKQVFQHESNGNAYYADLGYFDDAGSPIQVDVYTPNFDAGVRSRKTLDQLELVTDQVQGTVQIRFSDDDYQNWSSFESIGLGQTDGNFSTQQGTFRRRAYNFRFVGKTPFRLQSAEMKLRLGSQ